MFPGKPIIRNMLIITKSGFKLFALSSFVLCNKISVRLTMVALAPHSLWDNQKGFKITITVKQIAVDYWVFNYRDSLSSEINQEIQS